MISFLCNGYWLDMPPDSSVRIDEEMAHFQSDIFQGDISFPFEMPVTPTVVKALGHLYHIDVPDKVVEFECDAIHIHGVSKGRGKLVVQKASKVSYSVNLVLGLAGLSIMDKKLPDFDYGGVRTIGTDTASVVAHANAQVLLSYPNADYNFPSIKNEDFYGSANPTFCGVLNRWHNGSFSWNGYLVQYNEETLVPQPYLLYVLKQVFKEAGYEVKGTFVDHPDIRQAMLYSNRALDKQLPWVDIIAELNTSYVSSSLLFVPLEYDTEVQDEYGFFFLGPPAVAEVQFPGQHFVSINRVITLSGISSFASVTVRVLLDGVQVDSRTDAYFTNGTYTFSHTFSFEVDYNNWGSDITLEIRATDTGFPITVTHVSDTLTITNPSPGNLNGYDTELDVANHVPDITAGELLRRLRGAPFFVNISADHLARVVHMDFTEDTLTASPDEDLTNMLAPEPVTEFTPVSGYTVKMNFPSSDAHTQDNFKTVPANLLLGSYPKLSSAPSSILNYGKYVFIQNVNAYFISEYQGTTPTWTYFTDYHPDVVMGDGADVISAEITPLLMRRGAGADIPGTSGPIPILRQKGQSKLFSTGLASFTDTRIMFWKGMQPGETAQTYPMATTCALNATGATVGQWVTRFAGTDGIFELYASKWLTALMRGEVLRGLINYTIVQLQKFTSGRKRLGGQSFFMRKRSTVYARNISSSEVELLKL